MTEAYIYDAVRTPRGKGKKSGSLHEITALELSTQTLEAIRDRNELDTQICRRRCARLRFTRRRTGRRHRPDRSSERRLCANHSRRSGRPFLCVRARSLQHGGCQRS